MSTAHRGGNPIVIRRLAALLLVIVGTSLFGAGHVAARTDPLSQPDRIMPAADRFGPVEGTPPAAAAYSGEDLVGFVFRTTDIVDAVGYSGKPIVTEVGIDLEGTITGVAVVDHSEPILLIGVPEAELVRFADGYVGVNVLEVPELGALRMSQIDIISGATVTALVVDDSIIKAARRVARSRNLGAEGPIRERGADLSLIEGVGEVRRVDRESYVTRGWTDLIGDGSVRRLQLSVGDVTRSFTELGENVAAGSPESEDENATFLDLFLASAEPQTIGRNLLGNLEYDRLTADLEEGEHAILIAGRGLYSFKGSGYVRGGIFDRIQLIQGDTTVRFRDRDHKRLGRYQASGSPRFDEIGLFRVGPEHGFDPTLDWRIEVLASRAIGPVDKAFTAFDLSYILPQGYIVVTAAPAPPSTPISGPAAGAGRIDEAGPDGPPLWQQIWRNRVVEIGILLFALGFLTVVFFMQDWLVRRPRLLLVVRVGFLTFTLVWLGAWAGAQLSVVNVLTVFNAFFEGFRWEFFLLEPLIFLLWFSLAAALLFWGRGPYCGWLCPFGAAQELLNRIARNLGVPQLRVPFFIHQRLWPIKYLLFLGLFAASLYELGTAEVLAEVEPFKTAIVLQFDRDWPFIVYAVVLLLIGLSIERFYCRYLCPLGAALAIPGRMRMFDWLKRRKQCGTECRICEEECMVQAIHPEGQINPNECLYCLHCQETYHDEYKCSQLIIRRKRREAHEAMAERAAARRQAAAHAESPDRERVSG